MTKQLYLFLLWKGCSGHLQLLTSVFTACNSPKTSHHEENEAHEVCRTKFPIVHMKATWNKAFLVYYIIHNSSVIHHHLQHFWHIGAWRDSTISGDKRRQKIWVFFCTNKYKSMMHSKDFCLPRIRARKKMWKVPFYSDRNVIRFCKRQITMLLLGWFT